MAYNYLFDYYDLVQKIEYSDNINDIYVCEIMIGKYIDKYKSNKNAEKFIKILIEYKNEKKTEIKESFFNEKK